MARSESAVLPERSENVVGIREIKSIADVVRELDLVHNKHLTKEVADDLFNRIGIALTNLPAKHDTKTSITIFIDGIEHHVTLKPMGNFFSLAIIPEQKL